MHFLFTLACGSGPHEPGHAPHGHGPHGAGHEGHEGHATAHHRFDDAAKWSAVFDDPARDAWQKPADVVRLMEVPAGAVVADLGAGTGYFVAHLAPVSGEVLALDVEPAMVAHLTKRAAEAGWTNVTAREVKPDDPGLAAASVDRILVVDTWHHVPDRVAYGKKLAAALKPGGRLIVVDFTLESTMGPPPSMRLGADAVVEELRAAGLDPKIAEETLPEQYVVVASRP